MPGPGTLRRSAWLSAAVFAACTVACERPEAGLHVVIDGPLAPGADFDRLSLVAYLSGDGTPLYAETVEGELLKLPFRFNLVSGPGTPAGTQVEVLASAERDGEIVSATRGTAELAPGSGNELRLTLPDKRAVPDAGPPTELCDDGFDDDGDSLADCADPDCAQKSCHPNGLVCSSGACGCGGGVVGQYRPAVSGFIPRQAARALWLQQGPRTGWVAIFGGAADAGALGTIELYQPASVMLEQHELTSARTHTSLAALADGTVMVVGGRAGGAALQTVERISFTSTALVAQQFETSPATALEDVAVVADGTGVIAASHSALSIQLPTDGGVSASVTELGALSPARTSGARIGQGQLVLASGPLTDAVDWVTREGAVSGPPLPAPVASAAVAPLPGGRVLVAGGMKASADGGLSATGEAFVIFVQGSALGLRQVGALPEPMTQPRAQALTSGWVFVEDQAPGSSAQPAWFDPGAERFVAAPAFPGERRRDEAWAATSDTFIRVGGALGDGTLSGSAYLLDLQCGP